MTHFLHVHIVVAIALLDSYIGSISAAAYALLESLS
jgi:hypothetical protein